MLAGNPRGLEITATLVSVLAENNSIAKVQVIDLLANPAYLRPGILVTSHEDYVNTMPIIPGPTGDWEEIDLSKQFSRQRSQPLRWQS